MSTSRIDCVLLGKMLKNGCLTLKMNAEMVNSLNVFPVPDGDTGANMYFTVAVGMKLDPSSYRSVGDYLAAFSEQILFSARGNSGVILSRYISGFADAAAGLSVLSCDDFVKCMNKGVEKAYAAVITPVEGTVLTVMREAAQKASSLKFSDFEEMFEFLLVEMKDTLNRTPEMLDVLREAGVVDSGGAGLLFFFRGLYDALLGKILNEDDIKVNLSAGSVDIENKLAKADMSSGSILDENGVFSYGYCTEFLLELLPELPDKKTFSLDELISFLSENGNSVVALREGDIVKVHVHTFRPDRILSKALDYGEFRSVKIENMSLQHSEQTVRPASRGETAVVAVAEGEGLTEYFKNFGVDHVISGGQTKNPSVNDFINSYNTVNADRIFVLPNNGNILMAAAGSAEMYKNSRVYIVPTRSVAEGLAALSIADFSKDDPEEIVSDMSFAASNVTTCYVTRSIRDCRINGLDVKNNSFIGLCGDMMLATGDDRNAVALDMIKKLCEKEEPQVVTLIYGKDVEEEEAMSLESALCEEYPLLETGIINGAQNIYTYIISLE